ncbi:MAG: hypothetical protein U0939_20500 [Pirellulales bacterium]
MRLKLLFHVLLLCSVLLVQQGQAAWTVENPTGTSSFQSTASITGGGRADLQGVSYTAEIISPNTNAVLNSAAGVSTGPNGMPQMATWSCTVPVPAIGYWDVVYDSTPLQGAASYRITPASGNTDESDYFKILKSH